MKLWKWRGFLCSRSTLIISLLVASSLLLRRFIVLNALGRPVIKNPVSKNTVQHTTDRFVASDGLRLFRQQWVPEFPRAALVVTHGYAEHSERYAPFAEFLTDHGVAVYALDHRGHGRSEGERANIKVFREFVHDLSRFVEYVREQHPNPPRFLLGHSMGGVVAAQLVLERPYQVEGVVLSAPYLQNATKVSPLLLKMSGFVSRVLPGLPTLKLDAGLISRDEAVVEAYSSDPAVYTGGTKARIGSEMLAAGRYVLGRAHNVTLPMLVLHGSADGIADPAGSQTFFERAASEDKTLKVYDGFYHEILNEPGKQEVYEDVLEWLVARLR